MFKSGPIQTILGAVIVCAIAATQAAAQKTFAAPDGSFSVIHPDNWTVSDASGKYQIKADDGSTYFIQHDSVAPTAGKDSAVDPILRDAAEVIAKGLLQNATYGGVKILSVPGGNGAVYRYRGKGAKSDSDLVEIWFAQQGGHILCLWPTSAPQSDHGFELTVMFQNLPGVKGGAVTPGRKPMPPVAAETTNGINGTGTGANETKKPNKKAGKGKPEAPAPIPAQPAMQDEKPAAAGTALTAPDLTGAEEFESYDGHIVNGDISFRLHMLSGNRVSAEWEKSVGRRNTYAGTYAGTDGNYQITLIPLNAASFGAMPMRLTLRSLGGQIGGGFSMGSDRRLTDIAQIRLASVVTTGKGKGKKKL